MIGSNGKNRHAHLECLLSKCLRTRLMMENSKSDPQIGVRLRAVRRQLFPNDGKKDLHAGSEENDANLFLEEIRKARENAKRRWNFDFEKEEPLPGRYEWVKVDEDLPEPSEVTKRNSRTEDSDWQVTENQKTEDTNDNTNAKNTDDKGEST